MMMTELDRVLVVDDHADIRDPLAEFLQRYGFSAVAAGSAEEMREALTQQRFDLVLLDIMLPDGNGHSLCRELRSRWGLPVVFMTGLDRQEERVMGLDLGAEDYVVKPFDPRELVARLNSIFRRLRSNAQSPRGQHAQGRSRRYLFDRWALDLARRELRSRDGQLVALSSMQLRLLQILVENANSVLSREQLLALMNRDGGAVFDRSVDSLVSRLRKKLEDDARSPKLLRTIWGDGYLLAADVRTE